jgi:hypothetical protein
VEPTQAAQEVTILARPALRHHTKMEPGRAGT